MSDSKFAEHWAQAQFCYFRAGATQNPVIKHLWIQLAQDWIALSENWGPRPDQRSFARSNKQPSEPSVVA